MTYRKAGAISFAASQSTRSRAGQAPHQRAMKRYEQLIKMAPHDNAGLIGKAQAPHVKRRGYPNNKNSVPACRRKTGRGAFGHFRASAATGSCPDQMNRNATSPTLGKGSQPRLVLASHFRRHPMKNLSARWFRGLMGVIRRLVPGRLASHGRGGRSPIPVLLQQDSQPEQRPLPGAYLPRARRD